MGCLGSRMNRVVASWSDYGFRTRFECSMLLHHQTAFPRENRLGGGMKGGGGEERGAEGKGGDCLWQHLAAIRTQENDAVPLMASMRSPVSLLV